MDFRVAAYLNWGQWVAHCPRCPNAEKRGTCDDGSTGGLDAEVFYCRSSHGGCGLRAGIDWPNEIVKIEQILRVRPPAFRNWFPGETLADLLAENTQHGYFPTFEYDAIGDAVDVRGSLEFATRRELLSQ